MIKILKEMLNIIDWFLSHPPGEKVITYKAIGNIESKKAKSKKAKSY